MTEESHAEKTFHDIRKYPNRRYYDTTTSRHLTLEEIQALIQRGHEVRVTDSKVGDDITSAVLTQILLSLSPGRLQVFPVPLLHALVRASEPEARELLGRLQCLSLLPDAPRAPRPPDPVADSRGPGDNESLCGAADLHRAIELLQWEVRELKAELSGRRDGAPPRWGL